MFSREIAYGGLIELVYEITTAYSWDELDYTQQVTLKKALNFIKSFSFDWDDSNEDFPNNLYHVGFAVDQYIFCTGYTGIAGNYWGTICNPRY